MPRFVTELSENLGAPENQILLLLCLFLNIPVALFYKLIPVAGGRHWFSIIWSSICGWQVFGSAIANLYGSVLLAYFMMKILPRETQGRAVTVVMFTHVTALALYRLFVDWDIIVDAPQMLICFKMSGLAMAYADGAKDPMTLRPVHKKCALQELPSMLEVFGFNFSMFGFLSGPAVEYKEYLAMARHRELSWGKDKGTPSPPLSLFLRLIVQLLVSAAGVVASLELFPLSYITSGAYQTAPLLEGAMRVLMAVMLFRFRFYLVWTLAELSAAVAGVGYNEQTNSWDVMRNVNLLQIEVAPNIRTSINSWNIHTARWLNTHVYQRVALDAAGQPSGFSTVAVFFVSALWHGVHINYFVFFLTGALFIELAKAIRRRCRPMFHYREGRESVYAFATHYTDGTSSVLAPLYDLAGLLLTFVFMNYNGVAFVTLDIRVSWELCKFYYFGPHVVCVVVLTLLLLTQPSKRKSSNKKDGGGAEKQAAAKKEERTVKKNK